MKVKALIIISFILLVVASFAQVNDGDAFFNCSYNKEYIRRHKIMSVTQTSYMDTNKLSTTVYHFDKKGFLQKQGTVDSNGNEAIRFLFKFNRHGELTRRITLPHEHYRGDTVVFYRTYRNNKIIKERSPYVQFTFEHFYNRRGNLIRTLHGYNSGAMTPGRRAIEYEYDGTGKLVHVTDRVFRGSSDSVEQWMSDRTMIYKDEKVNKVVEKIPNAEVPTNQGNVDYLYDSAGNLINVVSDARSSFSYTYDGAGLLKTKTEKFPKGHGTLSSVVGVDEYSYLFWK